LFTTAKKTYFALSIIHSLFSIMENTVAKKLEALLKLQSIDSKLDEIKRVRGDLPMEVQDLEDELIGIETRIKKFTEESVKLEEENSNNRNAIKEAERLMKKYQEQQQNVKNNREYEAITKEIELQDLDIQVANRRIREASAKLDRKKEQINDTEKQHTELKITLDNKRKELEAIMAESMEDEDKLMKEREKRGKSIEERLYNSYMRIRSNARNGLAVVTVKRDACGGCFNVVPPQRQADIREKRKLIVCEHCGRILADVEEIQIVPQEKVKRTIGKKKTEATTATPTAPTEEQV
jgi:predicted  nucleic acid-binding Zn-ribbon protein